MPLHQAAPRHAGTLTVLVVALSAVAWAQFETRSSSPIIYDPLAVAVGDFNHDGKLDVAAADYYYGQVAVLLGNGNGAFQPPVYYAIDSNLESVYWVTAADFRGNGNLDLAVADFYDFNISVLLGNGDGTFQSPVQYPTTGHSPSFVAVGDFNNDGKPDLLAAEGYLVSVFLGNGDGTFQPPIDNSIFFTAGEIPLAVGDFNHDGNLDVAVVKAYSPELGILLGNGDGTFRQGAEYAVGEFANSITVGDFTGTHKLDLAVTNGTGNQIYILLGNGDGTFQSEPPFSVSGPGAITTADVNGDGKLDLLFISSAVPSGTQFTVMLGNGDGTFQPPVYYPFFTEGTDIAVGDFNGDHKPDVAIADFNGDSAVDVLLSTSVVSFSPTTPLSFNPQLLGTTSAPQNVTLTNTGTTALSIASKRVSGPFQLASGTTCGSSVAPGGNCTLSVVFHPTTMGLKSGLLSLNDSASSKPQVIELSGTGTTLTVSPSQLNFGSQKVGTKSPPQHVTVTNTGSSAVSITGISLGGTYPSSYLEKNTFGSQLDPGATCAVSVSFAPGFTGEPQTALVMINGPGGAVWQQVPLTGTGT
jgi:FG-GAP-like repeat/Abnormal spindle-like microcephaly-assoc'd, ASPM-SPD-2-Hydin